MRRLLFSFVLLCLAATSSLFAGILTPRGDADSPIQILDHHVEVTILDGFSRTEVTQTFYNPKSVDLEAVYSAPLPSSAALAEVVVKTGETTIEGAVLPALEAEQIYDSEVARGRDAALAVKNEIFDFRFFVSPVRAGQTVEIRFAYLQPLEIDTGVGRYVYPMQPGQTDEQAAAFWLDHREVDGSFSVEVELRSGTPIAELRAPGRPSAQIETLEDGSQRVQWSAEGGRLEDDFVLCYWLEKEVPARIEMPAAGQMTFAALHDVEIETGDPVIERLRALRLIEELSRKRDAGLLPVAELRARIVDLGVSYQVVSDYTMMVALTEEAFSEYGLDRRNRVFLTLSSTIMKRTA